VVERACVDDVAFRVIAANQRPDHCTIARFRQRHEAALAGLFGVAVLAVDGTKVHANASQHQNLDCDEIAREILAEAGGRYAFMRRVLETDPRQAALRQTPGHNRAGVRQHQVQPPHRPLLTPRRSACRSEWRLISATHNLLKLHRSQNPLAPT
jgi:hypothetical protein